MKQPERQLPKIGIEYGEYENGTIWGYLETLPEGKIWAQDEHIFIDVIIWLIQGIKDVNEEANKTGEKRRMLDNGMQGQWIDNELVLRWLPKPGFGVAFKSQADYLKWLEGLIRLAIKEPTIKTVD